MKYLFYLILFFIVGCSETPESKRTVGSAGDSVTKNKMYEYRLDVVKESDGYVYNIYQDDRIIIHQPYIPGVDSLKCFKTKSEATSVGRFVVEKIVRGEMPTVSAEEVLSLGVDIN